VITASRVIMDRQLPGRGANSGRPCHCLCCCLDSRFQNGGHRGWGASSLYSTEIRSTRIGGATPSRSGQQALHLPYNDLDVVAGQGTLGVELAEQAAQLDAVFISVGCGDSSAGTGSALKHLRPETRVVGVWPENSPCLLRALEAGSIIDVPESAHYRTARPVLWSPGRSPFRSVSRSLIKQSRH